ncbi:restriction endonuclease subunit S [Vibrio sp. 707]|uniref:restriction endonuclease subunit S n=1 Tax=Vibrio TaxID=662 RepID=UPI00186A430D|nr:MULTISPECIES: restriction endonuclease subunit S [Vibrio]MBE4215315.1 restriction endonuclease subunit S [Vibrio parahaemolyticus]MDW2044613.1 restriction endonuclease subunit S [Vibrio sp. 708]MBM5062894.1 restriction endonuclease subunit S [Vibrio parahaemolyticus]MBS9948379.1 restriction endonuclease subunit S [Vibrio alginolyticus]MDW1911188.1 restriction endonuclease subunit S [Vibrio sp. 707]
MAVEKLITEHIDIWTSAVKSKSTSGRGSSKKLELYGVKKLRELILELAVRGKLVPQDPNDEPASVLLERIAAEKARLVKEKKITKPKKLAEVCDDEFSFELPSNWDIRRLPDVYYTISPSGKKLKSSDVLEHGTYPVIDQGQEAIAGYSNDEERVIDIESPIIIFGDHTRNIKYVDFSFVPGADGTKILCPIGIAPEFFYLQLRSYDIESRGYGRHFKILNENLFVIPSLEEQHRIVAKVDELMALCDQLEQQTEASIEAHQVLVTTLLDTLTNSADADELMQNWARISEHFDTLFTTEESIDQLKQTILQLAVMGKLVPQDPNDEPAAELLKRIAEEKAQLVKDKKIKKQKALPPISEDEKPFELPSGWEWSKLQDLCFKITDGEHSTPKRAETGHYLLSARNVTNEGIILGDVDYVPDYEFARIRNRCDPNLGDILISCSGSVGRVALVDRDNAYSMVRSAAMIRPCNTNLIKEYLALMLRSPYLQFQMKNRSKQSAQANLFLGAISNLVGVIPPLSEQERIVSKVSQLLVICDQLKSHLNDSRVTQLHLTDTIVEQVV